MLPHNIDIILWPQTTVMSLHPMYTAENSLASLSHWSLVRFFNFSSSAFSALMLLVGWQGHPACKWSGDVLVWLSDWSEVQITCIWSSWCHCHPTISCCSKIQNGLPFWCRPTQVVLEKRPLNRCSSSSSVRDNCVLQPWFQQIQLQYSVYFLTVICWLDQMSGSLLEAFVFLKCHTST